VRGVCFAYAIAPGLGVYRRVNGKRHGLKTRVECRPAARTFAASLSAGAAAAQNVFEGWYLSGTIGGATVNYDLAPAIGSVDTSGVLGGVVGGWSWQSGPIVLGIEGTSWVPIQRQPSLQCRLQSGEPNIDMMADLRLRAGYAIRPRVLLFGTFGGGGAEVALNPHWSARFNYQFTDFSSEKVNYPGGQLNFDPDASTYRGSLIYRF
jgi:outer membrane immunogenic protein